jgi:DNA-binding GntR family transcriptional regulator
VIAALRSSDAGHAEQVMQDHILDTAPLLAEFVTPSR